MDYNTDRPHLVIKEYGRNIQRLIRHAATLENKEERQNVAAGIVEMMNSLTTNFRHIEEIKAKLWHHLHLMAEKNIDVDFPYDFPDLEEKKKLKVEYPIHKLKFKHYGKNVETMVARAIEMEEGEKRKAFVEVIGNYMKMVYRNWSGESVSNEVIHLDLKTLSKGKIVLDDDVNLDTLSKSSAARAKQRNYSNNNDRNNKGGRNSNRHNNGRSNNNNRKKNYR